MTLKALPAGNGARSVVPSTQLVQGTGSAFATGYVAPQYAAEDIPSLYVPVPGDTAHQKGWGPVTTGNGWPADVITKAGADSTYHGADPLPAGKAAFTWMSINLNAKDLWPAPSVFHARDTAHGGDGLDNLIDAALDYAATLGIKLWVHLLTGVQSPAWWLSAAVPNGGAAINGSGATMGNCPQSNSQTPNVASDCPVWWHPEYYRSNTGNGGAGTGLYYDLFSRIQALYESNANFAGIVVAGPMTVFPEPMSRDLSGTVTGAAPTRIQILTADGGAYDAAFNLTAFGSFLKGPAALPSTPELDGTFLPITLTDSTGTHTYPYGLYQDSFGGLSAANDILAHYYALKAHKAIFATTRQQYACNPYASLIGTGTNVKYFDPSTGIYTTDQGNGTAAKWQNGQGGYVFDNVGATFDLARAARKIDGNVVLSNESARFVMIPGGPAGHEWEVNPSTGKLKLFDTNSYTSSPAQPGSKNIQYPHMFVGLRTLGAPYFEQTASASTDPTGDRIGAGVGDWLIGYMAANMVETPSAYNSIWAGALGTERSNTSNPNTATYDPAHAYHSGDYAIGANAVPYKITFTGGGTYTGNSQSPAVTDPAQDAVNWTPFPGGILPIGGTWTLAGLPVGPIQPGHAYAVGAHVVGAFNMVYQAKKAVTTPAVLDDTDDPSQDTKNWKLATDARISWTPVGGVYDPSWGWFQPYPQSRSNEFSPSHYQAQTASMQALSATGSGSTPPAIGMPVNGTPPAGGGTGGGAGGGTTGGSTPASTSVYPVAFDRFANRIKRPSRLERLFSKVIDGMRAVQLELGINPSGTYVDVASRLADAVTNSAVGAVSGVAPMPDAAANAVGQVIGYDSSVPASFRWFTSQEHVARALGWFIATDPQWAGGADPTGATDSAPALRALGAALPPSNATIYFPPGTYLFTSAVSGVIFGLTAKNNCTIMGAGQATIIRMQNVTATDGIRIDGCRSFTMHNIAIEVTNAAAIANAVQFTCPIGGGAHNGAFTNVLVSNPSSSARSIFDAATEAGSPVVTSSQAAFVSGDVGGMMGVVQLSDVLTGKVLSVATRTATVSNGGTALTSSQTTIPLAAPIPSAPNTFYTIIIDSERMFVTGGFQTSTLTVTRGYDLTTPATHADGASATTYQATLDTQAFNTSTNPLAAKIQTPGSAVMLNGIAVGTDHASGALDIPQLKFVGTQVEGAIGCGWRLGPGVPGNILDVSHTACEAALSTVGVFMNGAVTKWSGPSMGSNGVDFKVGAPSSQPVVLDGVRSELSGVLWEMTGAGTGAGTSVTIRDSKIASFGAPDGVPIRHIVSIPLSLDQVGLTRPVAGATVLIQASGVPANPLYYSAKSVATNGGNLSPHPAASTSIIRTILPGPRLSGSGNAGVKASYGAAFDDMQVTTKRLAAQTLASGGAVTIDASQGDAVVTLQANATSSSITNPQTGQELRITWLQDATGGRTYSWPTNSKFAGGSPPSDTTASTRTTVTFRYDGTNWNEVGRAVAVG